MKILIIAPAWVGDMVMSQSLYRLIKQLHPESSLTVLAPAYTAPLLARMPEVDETLAVNFPRKKMSFLKRRALGKSLKPKGFDWAIILPNSWKSALIPYFAGIPKRTGFIGECRYGLINDIRKLFPKTLPKMIDRFCALALGPHEKAYDTWPLPKLTASENPEEKRLWLCPGAEFGPAKQWPAEHFATLGIRQAKLGWKIGLLGSPKDQDISDKIEQLMLEQGVFCDNQTGKTSLQDAIEKLAAAAWVVSNDSGLMHIACALNRKVTVLYGSTSPSFTPPLSPHAKVLQLKLPCQPCFKRVCPLQGNAHMACLTQLTPDFIEEF